MHLAGNRLETENKAGRGEFQFPVPKSERLPRSCRILNSDDFSKAFASGTKRVGKYMVMWSIQNNHVSARLGVVTSKKSFRRAIDRNKVRRWFRESFRKNRSRFVPGFDIVLVARNAALHAGYFGIENELVELASKSDLLLKQGKDGL